MDPDRWKRALNFEASCVAFFNGYFQKIDRMQKITKQMKKISECFTLLKERSERTRRVAAVGFAFALVLWFYVASSSVSVGLGAMAVAGLSTGGATFIFLSRQQEAEEELVCRMSSLAAEVREKAEPLKPKLYDVYSASMFEGIDRRNAKLLRHGARVVELLSALNSLRTEIKAGLMSEVAAQYSRTVEGLQTIRSRMMIILEN